MIKGKNHRFIKLSAAAILIAAIGVGVAIQLNNHNKPAKKEDTHKSGGSGDKINLSPPTKEQSGAAGIDKTKPGNGGGSSSSTGKTKVTPVISNWGRSGSNLYVSGFVQGVAEDGGTCTFKLKMNGKVKTATTTGVLNASNTSCGQAAFNYGALGKGAWQAYLTYSSTTAQGTSSPVSIEVK